MLKLLLCLIAAFLTAVAVLELRQQELNLNFQSNRLHNEIERRQSKLWSQQLQIAGYTAPNAIAKTIGNTKLDLTPQAASAASAANWMGKNGDTATAGE